MTGWRVALAGGSGGPRRRLLQPRPMDAATPRAALQHRPDSTRALLARLWREHVNRHKPRVALVLLLTLVMAGTTALYPVVIDHAFEMFTNHDRRILYQIPALVVLVTSVKAAAQYFQNVQVQQVVLLVIRELQGRMFSAPDPRRPDAAGTRGAGPARRPLHHRCGDHPRGADPGGERRRRRDHGGRAGRHRCSIWTGCCR